MLYAVANEHWSPGRPLSTGGTRPGLFRWRAEAEAAVGGRPTLAVVLRFDAALGVVVPEGPVARAQAEGWSAPATVDAGGAVTVLAPIPGALVRPIGAAEVRAHPGSVRPVRRPFLATRSRPGRGRSPRYGGGR